MTKQMTTSYIAFLCVVMVMAVAGIMTVHASEVTGTLSSDTTSSSQTDGDIEGSVSNDSQTSGNIAGTVSGGSSGSSGGGSGGGSRISAGGGGSDDSSDEPSGAVLGAATDNQQAPGFPNTGMKPSAGTANQSFWSGVTTFLRGIFSF